MKTWMTAALVLLAGCGGGGGGGGSDTPPPPPPPLASVLRVSNVSPAQITMAVPASSTPMAGVELRADVVGDLTRLAGQTVYVLIEDPRNLFEVVSTVISPNGLGNSVMLRLKSTLELSGLVDGSLRLRVCTDPACNTQLGNSPTAIPYAITVRTGARLLDAAPLEVTVPFGAPAIERFTQAVVERAVRIDLPADLFLNNPPFGTDWIGLSGAGSPRLAGLSYDAVTPGQVINGKLSFAMRPVGQYVAQLQLTSSLNNLNRGVESRSEVRYTVTDTGIPVAFYPRQLDVQRATSQQYVTVVGADGTVYDRVARVSYSSNSLGVAWLFVQPQNPESGQLSRQFEIGADRCQSVGGCLPPGSYSAQVYFGNASGRETPLAWTVNLRVD